MSDDQARCPYCKDLFSKSRLKDHLNYEHDDKIRSSIHRLKIALPLILVGFSFVLGMLWMGILH